LVSSVVGSVVVVPQPLMINAPRMSVIAQVYGLLSIDYFLSLFLNWNELYLYTSSLVSHHAVLARCLRFVYSFSGSVERWSLYCFKNEHLAC
jgi:hypothetical protein